MGVEPTATRSARPAANFEDWEAHRDSYTPIPNYILFCSNLPIHVGARRLCAG